MFGPNYNHDLRSYGQLLFMIKQMLTDDESIRLKLLLGVEGCEPLHVADDILNNQEIITNNSVNEIIENHFTRYELRLFKNNKGYGFFLVTNVVSIQNVSLFPYANWANISK